MSRFAVDLHVPFFGAFQCDTGWDRYSAGHFQQAFMTFEGCNVMTYQLYHTD